MESRGVIHYRLSGNHPAASGKLMSIGFPGEVVSVEKLLVDIIEQNQINLANFKLEVRQYVDTPSSENSNNASDAILPAVQSNETVLLALHDALRTYDRLTINISRRHLGDVNPVVQPPHRESYSRLLGMAVPGGESNADRLDSVASGMSAAGNSALLADVDGSAPKRTGGISFEALQSVVSSMRGTDRQGDSGERNHRGTGGASDAGMNEPGVLNEKSNEADDAQQLERLAAVANIRQLPLYAGNPPRGGPQQPRISVPKHVSSATYGYPAMMVEEIACILCNLAVSKPIKLQCCGYTVCYVCFEYACAIVDEGQCPVCGNALQSGDVSQPHEGTTLRSRADPQEDVHCNQFPHSMNRNASSSILKDEALLDGGSAPEAGFTGSAAHLSKLSASGATRAGQKSSVPGGAFISAATNSEQRAGQAKASDPVGITPRLSPNESTALFSRALEMLSKSALAEVVGGTDEVIVRLQHDAVPTPTAAQQEWTAAKRRIKRSRDETRRVL